MEKECSEPIQNIVVLPFGPHISADFVVLNK